ncbi:LysR family transcriptional regulator [Mesorhizobium sp. M0664]|uniref:LysR family transcriptional regulator n=1 Tax=Mesorhizobium sp. M0664 TaxID=2956982 RepID=UPI0033365E57
MNLRQIEVFHAVMTIGTASRAAEILRISQPAVSKAVQELERDIGFASSTASKDGVADGRRQPVFQGSGDLILRPHRFERGRGADSRLRFGGNPDRKSLRIKYECNAKGIKGFQHRHPDVAITFQARLSSEVKELVASGQFDVGLAADEIDLAGVEAHPFRNYRVAIAMPKGHPLEGREVIRPADLHGQAFIALAPEDTTRREAEAIFADHGIQPKVVLETPYSTTICSMVNAGLGCGMVNPLTALPYLNGNLSLRPFLPGISFRTLLLLPPNRRPSRVVSDFIEQLMRIALEIDGAVQT